MGVGSEERGIGDSGLLVALEGERVTSVEVCRAGATTKMFKFHIRRALGEEMVVGELRNSRIAYNPRGGWEHVWRRLEIFKILNPLREGGNTYGGGWMGLGGGRVDGLDLVDPVQLDRNQLFVPVAGIGAGEDDLSRDDQVHLVLQDECLGVVHVLQPHESCGKPRYP